MGISCVIDPDGRVIALPGDSWSGSKKMDGIAVANVPLDIRASQYARFGDWLPGLCWLLLVLGHLKSMWNKRLRANAA
jgi:apolipoprotein N-acyltransferase